MPYYPSNSGGRYKSPVANYAGGAVTRNRTATQIAGPMPDPRNSAIFGWYNTVLNARLANVPLTRGTVYYFSAAGHDTNNNGLSPAAPFLTLSKAQALLTAAGTTGGITLLFNRGDTWREDQLLALKDHVSIGSYGSGNKPVFTRFVHQYTAGGGGWTNDTTTYYRTATQHICCVIVTANKLTRPLTIAHNLATCQSTDDSWFWDSGTNRLYVRLGSGPTNPNTLDLEACVGAGGYHVDLLGDDIRFQGIRLEGYGVRRHAADTGGTVEQTYGIALRPDGATEECVAEDIEVYFTGYHAVGILSSTGGFGTVKNLTSGFCRPGPGGDATNVVSFSSSGSQEALWENLTSVAGNLFETNLGAASGRIATGVYGHTASGENALAIVRGHTVTPGAWSVRYGTYFANLPTAAAVTDAKGLIIDEVIDDVTTQPNTRFTTVDCLPSNQARINCRYNLWCDSGSNKSIGSLGAGFGINLDVTGYATNAYSSLFKSVSDGGAFYGCRLRYVGYGAIFTAAADANAWDALVGDGTILECINPDGLQGETAPNVDNAAGNFDYCAWHARDPVPANVQTAPSGTDGVGAIGGTGKVILPAASPVSYVAPDSDSVLAGAGNPSAVLNYDYNRATRSTATIGPLNASTTPRAAISTLSSVTHWWKAGDLYDATVGGFLVTGSNAVARWQASAGGVDWIQGTGANQPARGSNGGIQGGASKFMTGTIGALGTFTVYAVCVRTTSTVGTVLGKVGGTGTGQYVGVYSDNNAYLINDAANTQATAANQTSKYLARWARVPNNAYYRGTAIDAATMSSAGAGNCTFDALLARTGGGGEYSHSSFELVEIVLCAGDDTRGTADEAVILADLYARHGVVLL